jgi:hypothetical protein
LSEGVNDGSDSHIFEDLPALFVDTQVANTEESNPSGTLRRTLVVSHYIQELFKSSKLDQILAESVGVSDEVAQSTCCIGSGLFFLVLQEIHKQRDTWFEVLVEHIVVESSISHSKASELPSVSIRISAALNGCLNQPKLKELFVEEACVSAQVTNKIAHLGSDSSILMHYQSLQLIVDVSLMDVFIEVFGYSCELRDQR